MKDKYVCMEVSASNPNDEHKRRIYDSHHVNQELQAISGDGKRIGTNGKVDPSNINSITTTNTWNPIKEKLRAREMKNEECREREREREKDILTSSKAKIGP